MVPVPRSKSQVVWLLIVLGGMTLVALGLAAFSIDFVAVGQFDFIERHCDVFGLAILVGLGCLLIGLIGSATSLDKIGRLRVATLALVLPLIIVAVASLSIGTNVHGVFPLFVISLFPVFVSGLVVAIMGAFALR